MVGFLRALAWTGWWEFERFNYEATIRDIRKIPCIVTYITKYVRYTMHTPCYVCICLLCTSFLRSSRQSCPDVHQGDRNGSDSFPSRRKLHGAFFRRPVRRSQTLRIQWIRASGCASWVWLMGNSQAMSRMSRWISDISMFNLCTWDD